MSDVRKYVRNGDEDDPRKKFTHFYEKPKKAKKLKMSRIPTPQSFREKSQLNQVVFKIIWLQIGDQTTTTTTNEF